MNDKIKLHDKEFELYISPSDIDEILRRLSVELNQDLMGKKVMFLAILNGAFMFAADLIREINFVPKVSFLKLASYSGASSTGRVKQLIGLNEDLKGMSVIVLEDIVDTGATMDNIVRQIQGFEPNDIRICTFLFKPNAYQGNVNIDYVGKEIPNDFVVGYGLDYDGLGRHLNGIYKVIT
jgi:hypoxanthine phosphoribosyltransferase